jgi:hypothetical protein
MGALLWVLGKNITYDKNEWKNTHRVLPTASFKLPGASYWGSKSTSVLRTLPQLKFINYMIKMFKN